MFTILFASVVEFALWSAAIYVGYRILFYKSIKEKKEMKVKHDNAEKIALIMLKSSSNKEVQNFMKDNVSFLSKETFNKLNEHLDYLNVLSEEPLKARFEELEPAFEDGLVEESKEETLRNKV